MRELRMYVYILPMIACASSDRDTVDASAEAAVRVPMVVSYDAGESSKEPCRRFEVTEVDIDGRTVRFVVPLPCREYNPSRDFGDPQP